MIKFGTGGWRAIIGDEFTKANIEMVAQAMADEMNSKKEYKKQVVVGYDRRFLSKEAAYWFMSVLAGNNIKSYFIDGGTPTPVIMHKIKVAKLDFGICITASHNPALYNGVKIFIKEGRDCPKEITDKFEEKFTDIKIKKLTIEEAKKSYIEEIEPQNEYIDSIIDFIDYESIKKRNFKVAFDPMFGSATKYLTTLLSIFRCDHYGIHTYHDTLYGKIAPTPTKESLGRLSHVLNKEKGKYDLGFASDGDGDRLALLDENGDFISSNETLVLLYHYLLTVKKKKGGVVRNVSTTSVLDKVAEKNNEKCIEVPVGFKYISKGMDDYNCILGGESSGGLTIKGHIKGKDSMFAISVVFEMLANTEKTLSELLKEVHKLYGKTSYLEENIKLKSQEQKELLEDIFFKNKLVPDFSNEIEKVHYLDGLKVKFKKGGWITIRFSGTEPVLRLNIEMETTKQAREVLKEVKGFLKEQK